MKNGLSERIRRVQDRIENAARKAGRDAAEITLVAVSKKQPIGLIEEAIACGISEFGENRVQELVQKFPLISESLSWHFIGHLQKNKIRQVLDKVVLVHSVDSVELAKEIDRIAEKKMAGEIRILLEVNTSGETSKYGFVPEQVLDACAAISELKHVSIHGLMTMAPFTDDEKVLAKCFNRTRELSEKIKMQKISGVKMRHLSMGMSNDFEIAVREGSTMLRLGTIIFGPRKA